MPKQKVRERVRECEWYPCDMVMRFSALQRSKDRLYITQSEWRDVYGGKKRKAAEERIRRESIYEVTCSCVGFIARSLFC